MSIVAVISIAGANADKVTDNRINDKNIEISISTPYLVVKVIDGDTFDIKTEKGKLRIRMIGVDTPEIKDPRKKVQCFAKESSKETKNILLNKYIKIENDNTQDRFDKYNRFLAYVYINDGELFNSYLIKNGFAHEYTYKIPYIKQKEFKELENEAREAKRGLWGDKCNK